MVHFLQFIAVTDSCKTVADATQVAVICAANRLANGEIKFAPLAMFFSSDPHELLIPPNPDGGFQA